MRGRSCSSGGWPDQPLALYATPSEIKYFQSPLASRITQLAVVDADFIAAHLQDAGEELLERRLT
jgi:DNA-binding MurR/RpiR family transcriptional regulator